MPEAELPSELRVDENKVVDYLLNPAKSRGKAGFFLRLGFRPEKWQVLAEALREQARGNPVVNAVVSPYGMRYSVDGPLQTPDPRAKRCRRFALSGFGKMTVARGSLQLIQYRRVHMLEEHSQVVLAQDLPTLGLEVGDVGVIVHVHAHGEAYEVEFITLDGETIGVETVETTKLRSVGRREIPHVRQLLAA